MSIDNVLIKLVERIEKAEKIMSLACSFIINAKGSWETGEGECCLNLIREYHKNYKEKK